MSDEELRDRIATLETQVEFLLDYIGTREFDELVRTKVRRGWRANLKNQSHIETNEKE